MGRIGVGRLDRRSKAVWRAERKRAVTVVASSRWAGAITRVVEDQYQLGMRGVAAHVADLRQAVDVLEQRCAVDSGESAPACAGPRGGPDGRRRGYRSASERFAKTRRLAVLRSRLASTEHALAAGRPSIAVGGKRLWRSRHHLDAAAMTERQWRARWEAARMFLTADGESGKAGGNETIRVDEAGRLRIKVPAALTPQFGSHLQIAVPIRFGHRGDRWTERVAGRRAVRYDISFDPAKDRWYLDASWKQDTPAASPSIDELRTGPVLGVDLNADHLACCVLDGSGNPVGEPVSIPVQTAGLAASHRDGRVRAAITALLDLSERQNCSAVVVENLDFADARATGRETSGSLGAGETVPPHRGRHPHREIPRPADFDGGPSRDRGDRCGCGLHQPLGCPALGETLAAADFRPGHPASRRGGRDRQTWPRIGDQATAGRTPQRTADRYGHATGRPEHQPNHDGRQGSSGPPTRTRCVPVHRRTPAASGQHRSGRAERTNPCSPMRNGRLAAKRFGYSERVPRRDHERTAGIRPDAAVAGSAAAG
jgi:hypothetical protein